jgi:hypothetical protein
MSHYYLLSNEISNLLDEMPLAVLNRLVFHQNGAIPHNARINVVFYSILYTKVKKFMIIARAPRLEAEARRL